MKMKTYSKNIIAISSTVLEDFFFNKHHIISNNQPSFFSIMVPNYCRNSYRNPEHIPLELAYDGEWPSWLQEPVGLRGSVEFSEKLFEYRRIKQMKRTLLETCFSHKIDHAQCSVDEILVRMQRCLVLTETQQGNQ